MSYDPQQLLDDIPDQAYTVAHMEHLRDTLGDWLDGLACTPAELRDVVLPVTISAVSLTLIHNLLAKEIARCTRG